MEFNIDDSKERRIVGTRGEFQWKTWWKMALTPTAGDARLRTGCEHSASTKTAMADDVEVRMSGMSGYETHEGLSVRVEIFQFVGMSEWWLEVIDPNGRLTRWDEPFASEKDAYLEFCATVVVEGMREFTP